MEFLLIYACCWGLYVQVMQQIGKKLKYRKKDLAFFLYFSCIGFHGFYPLYWILKILLLTWERDLMQHSLQPRRLLGGEFHQGEEIWPVDAIDSG